MRLRKLRTARFVLTDAVMYARTRPRVIAAFTAALAAGVAPTAFAQCDKARSHRPVEDLFASDVVYLQEQGEVQLELKPARTRTRGARTTTLEADIEYGARDWWQLETEWEAREWTRSPDGTVVTAGVGDIGIGSRVGWRCIAGSSYHLAMGMDVSIPGETVGNFGEATRHVGLAPSLIVARDIGRAAQLFSAIEIDARLNHRRTGVAGWTYSSDTGLFVRVVRGFHVTAEVSVEGGPDEDRDVHVLPGVLWHWRDHLEIGAALLTPVSRNTSHGLLAHVVCELGGRHETQ
jgi:hypothetical protein